MAAVEGQKKAGQQTFSTTDSCKVTIPYKVILLKHTVISQTKLEN